MAVSVVVGCGAGHCRDCRHKSMRLALAMLVAAKAAMAMQVMVWRQAPISPNGAIGTISRS